MGEGAKLAEPHSLHSHRHFSEKGWRLLPASVASRAYWLFMFMFSTASDPGLHHCTLRCHLCSIRNKHKKVELQSSKPSLCVFVCVVCMLAS